MNNAKKVRLQRAEWIVGDAAEFLGLTPQEAQFVEMKMALFEQLGSRQSRVSKLEAGHPNRRQRPHH